MRKKARVAHIQWRHRRICTWFIGKSEQHTHEPQLYSILSVAYAHLPPSVKPPHIEIRYQKRDDGGKNPELTYIFRYRPIYYEGGLRTRSVIVPVYSGLDILYHMYMALRVAKRLPKHIVGRILWFLWGKVIQEGLLPPGS